MILLETDIVNRMNNLPFSKKFYFSSLSIEKNTNLSEGIFD